MGLVSPDTGIASSTVDAMGNARNHSDSRGVLQERDYDALNRLVSATYSLSGQPSQTFSWNYDESGDGFAYGYGRMTSTRFPRGSTKHAFDAQGRSVMITQVVAGAEVATLITRYGYDPAGRIISITYPSGRVLHIPHAGGVPAAISIAAAGSSNAIPLISELDFEPVPGFAGPARSWVWHLDTGTLRQERVFDDYGRVIRYPLGGAVRDLAYDAAGRIASYTHLDASVGASTVGVESLNQNFSYDELGRLVGIATAMGQWSIAYDDNGNRLVMETTSATGAVARNYSIAGDSNRLLGLDNPVRMLVQDLAGNTVTDLQGRVGWSAIIDLAGRIASLSSSPDGSNAYVTQYDYNALGQRILKMPVSASCIGSLRGCEAGSTRRASVVFAYDLDGRLLGEYAANGSPLREYVWLQDMPVAIVDGDLDNTKVFYVYADHLNTPRVVIDRVGRQRWSWLAEPFGQSAPVTNPLGFGMFNLNLRMPGQYFDLESGLSYNYFRHYDGSVGRYTQSDPIGLAGGINTYSYVNGNPLSGIDPEGLAGCAVSFPDYPIDTGFGFTSNSLGGHGGVLSYDSQGATRYYEYGRYALTDPLVIGDKRPADDGNVRRVPVPDLQIDPRTGQPTPASMDALRRALASRAGHSTKTELSCEANADEKKINKYAEDFAKNASRPKYSWKPWSSNQCRDFANRALGAGR